MSEKIGMIAGVLSLTGYALYIRAVLKGNTKPSRTTWWIWSPLAITLFFSAEASGAAETLWVAKSEVLGIITIALISLKFGKKEREKGEWFCIIGSTVSIAMLWIFKAPEIALVLALITDSLALWPTIQKTKRYPEEEDAVAWSFTQSANIFNLFAISTFNFGEIVYPVWLFVLDGIVLWYIFKKGGLIPTKN